jgi:hypothetical protein
MSQRKRLRDGAAKAPTPPKLAPQEAQRRLAPHTSKASKTPVRLRIAQASALFLNLAGTILLALSFLATASDFRLVTASNYALGTQQTAPGQTTYAICVKNYALAATDGRGVGIGFNGCPSSETARPAAVVTSELPWLLYLGLALTSLGFFIQFILVIELPVLALFLSR